MKFKIILIIISIVLLGIIGVLYNKINSLKSELDISITNNKAYQTELQGAKEESYMYKLSNEQLKYFNDSITQKLKEARENVKIKEKNVIQYQYINTVTTKIDTVEFTDTIFKNNVSVDTIIGDEWYSVDLKLKFPDSLIMNPKFKNETIVLISSKKETIDPPKKWWWQRLFQKKHIVVKVNVVENNPYSEVKEQRFIETIK